MKNYDQLIKINDNPNWPYIPHHPYRILIIGGSGLGKTNVLLNLIKKSTTRYWQNLFIFQRSIRIKVSIIYQQKRKCRNLKNEKIQKHSLIIHKKLMMIEDWRKRKGKKIKKKRVLIVLDDTITDMKSNKKLSPFVTELFLRGKKPYVSLIFIS